jgi:NAD(P)-dependent dehydrogenase (short-subunit alcohol dehydrogenase family)
MAGGRPPVNVVIVLGPPAAGRKTTVPRALEGKVAVVLDAGEARGRAFAIRLAALGARVVAAGRFERAVGETVGEIAFAGGQARLVLGGVEDAVARAMDTWGRLDIVVETGLDPGPPSPR